MAPKFREITAFSTLTEHYDFRRMPFGLKSAPISFQRMINTLFSDMLGNRVFAYFDDVIICNKVQESQFAISEAVLLKLEEACLKAKVTKCEFLNAKISSLGHMVDEHGIHTMGDKIMAIKIFPQPQDVEEVRSFIGLCGYYRCFVKNFAALASPLNQLMKNIAFQWSAAQAKSVKALKQALTNAPFLAFSYYSTPYGCLRPRCWCCINAHRRLR